jgi:hypothetical protein
MDCPCIAAWAGIAPRAFFTSFFRLPGPSQQSSGKETLRNRAAPRCGPRASLQRPEQAKYRLSRDLSAGTERSGLQRLGPLCTKYCWQRDRSLIRGCQSSLLTAISAKDTGINRPHKAGISTAERVYFGGTGHSRTTLTHRRGSDLEGSKRFLEMRGVRLPIQTKQPDLTPTLRNAAVALSFETVNWRGLL